MALRFSATVVGAAVVGLALFALGAVLGWGAANRFASARESLSGIGEGFMFAQMATVQYDNANADAAHIALNTYLRYLENPPPDFMGPRMIAAAKALTLARLALLDEREKKTTEADELWSRAESEAKAAGWKDPSRRRIREVVEQIDAPRQTRKPGP